jgi:hypothetical protein
MKAIKEKFSKQDDYLQITQKNNPTYSRIGSSIYLKKNPLKSI